MYWNCILWLYSFFQRWLTLTWDVLKYEMTKGKEVTVEININMRCIEIQIQWWQKKTRNLININMRCIEIFLAHLHWLRNQININMRCIEMRMNMNISQEKNWLTLTWDVLKSDIVSTWNDSDCRLTLTWDVLKSFSNTKARVTIRD